MRLEVTWGRFWNGPMGPYGPISKEWNVPTWPWIVVVCVVCTGAWTLYAWRFDGLGWWGGDAESASIARQDAAPDAGGDRTLLRASTPNAGVGPSNAAPGPRLCRLNTGVSMNCASAPK